MSKRTKCLIGLACIVSLIAMAAPVYFYIIDFGDLPRSSDLAKWGMFGDFIGGILNPIISFLTLIVTVFIAVYINKIESRNHNETVHNTVKPLLIIGTGDFYSSDVSRIGPTIHQDFYDYEPPTAPTLPNEYFTKQFYLKVTNKGLGIANQVNVNFNISLTELRELLIFDNKLIKVTSTDIKTDEDGRNYIVLTIKADSYNFECFFYKIWEFEWSGLGVIDKDEEVYAVIPSQIMGLFQLFNEIRKLSGTDKTFPTMFVSFEYKNIYDKVLSSMIKVGFFHSRDYPNFSVYRILQEQVQ